MQCTIIMHRCLGILDVLELILGQLRPADTPLNLHYNDLGDSRNVAAFARTCRMFLNPALDVLWKAQTLENVFRCIPPGLIEERVSAAAAPHRCELD